MLIRLFSLAILGMLLHCGNLFASGGCGDYQISTNSYREKILDGKYNDLLSDISFPLNAQVGGKTLKIMGDTPFQRYSKYIFTKDFLDTIEKADTCKLVSIFGMQQPDDKIHSLVYLTNQEDLVYSGAGISSAEKLFSFLESIETLAQKGDYKGLAPMFLYPFLAKKDGVIVEINDVEEFVTYGEYIVTDDMLRSIAEAVSAKDFIQHQTGLGLTPKGDYWVRPFADGKMLFVPLNIRPEK